MVSEVFSICWALHPENRPDKQGMGHLPPHQGTVAPEGCLYWVPSPELAPARCQGTTANLHTLDATSPWKIQ